MNDAVSPTIRLTGWVFVTMVLTIIVVSFIAEIEIIARGKGKIIPIDKVQIIQAQENGKIVAIWVKEGDSVRTGQRLLSLDKTDAQSQIDSITSDIEKQSVEKTVSQLILDALDKYDPSSPLFLKNGLGKSPLHSLVYSTLKAIQDEILALDAAIDKTQAARTTQEIKITSSAQELEFAQKQYDSALDLRKSGTISQFSMLEREANLKKIQNNLDVVKNELSELNAAKIESQKQRIKIISQNKSTFEIRKSTAEIALNGLNGQLKLQQARLKNTELIAPISGKIENLAITTNGAFVEAGREILTIVPSNGKVEIEAFVENRDIGFLRAGQPVFVKFDAFPAERFGFVKGNVVRVGADARDEKSANMLVYMVRISLQKDHVLSSNMPIKFVAGMSVTVDVVTGERKLASYFFEPIIKAIQDGFGER
jgi:hemolysin D